MKISFIKSKIHLILLLLIMATNLFFGLPRIANFSAIDEHLWTYDRTPQFWKAVKEQNWKKTNINDKPGITVAIISGIGLMFINPMDYEEILQEPKSDDQLESIRKINFSFRFPIYLFTLLMAPLFFILLKRLFNETVAIISVGITYLSPIILGISLFVNPDSFLWIFSTLSILCFLLLQKTDKSAYAYASGVFLGLALLTKYVSTLLYPYFLAVIFLNYLFLKSKKDPKRYFKKAFSDYLRMILVSLATIFILYPATWINLEVFLNRTIFSRPFEPIWKIFAVFLALFFVDAFLLKSYFLKKILDPVKKYKKYLILLLFSVFLLAGLAVILNTYKIINIYDFELLLASPKGGDQENLRIVRSIGGVLTGIYVLFFELSPLVFLSLIFAVVSSLKKEFLEKRSTEAIFFLLIFILLYYFGSAMSFIESTVRYQISIYPIASIIAALGLYRLINLEKIKKIIAQKMFALHLIFIIALSVSLFAIKPFYFSYASSLLPKNYVLNVKDMGDGCYEASAYLNSLPDARNLTVWTDKVAFCELFAGKCYSNIKAEVIDDPNLDYFVVSRGRTEKSLSFASERVSRKKYEFFKEMYSSNTNSEYEINIDGRPNNFIRVIKNK